MPDAFREGPNTLRVPFIFVKHGDPPPLEWMARHPGWVKFPAVMIPRNSPQHPANGGAHPRFPLPPPAKRAEATRSDEEEWPFGKPASAGLRGAMSRIRPGGVPPRYPGGLGAPSGTCFGQGEDPIAVYRRVNAAFERSNLVKLAESVAPVAGGPATLTPEQIGDARERAFLRLLRWSETGDEPDDKAYHERYGGRDPMTDAEMLNYQPKEEKFPDGKGIKRSYPDNSSGPCQALAA